MKIVFDFYCDQWGIIPVTAEVERKSGDFIVLEVDACDHDGGELSSHLLDCIEQKARDIAHDRAMDFDERARADADDRRLGL